MLTTIWVSTVELKIADRQLQNHDRKPIKMPLYQLVSYRKLPIAHKKHIKSRYETN